MSWCAVGKSSFAMVSIDWSSSHHRVLPAVASAYANAGHTPTNNARRIARHISRRLRVTVAPCAGTT